MTHEESQDRFAYSMQEVADLLGVSYMSVHRAVQRGELPSARLGGRVLIPAQVIEDLLTPERVRVG